MPKSDGVGTPFNSFINYLYAYMTVLLPLPRINGIKENRQSQKKSLNSIQVVKENSSSRSALTGGEF